MGARTLYQVLEEAARHTATRRPCISPTRPGYLTYSWNQYRRPSRRSPPGCARWASRKGDVVALNSETRLEFYLADLGIMANGSIAAALYPSYPPRPGPHHRRCRRAAVFVEDPKTLEALRRAPGRATGFCSPARPRAR